MDRCVDAVDLVVVWERLAKAGGRRVPITKKAAAAWAVPWPATSEAGRLEDRGV